MKSVKNCLLILSCIALAGCGVSNASTSSAESKEASSVASSKAIEDSSENSVASSSIVEETTHETSSVRLDSTSEEATDVPTGDSADYEEASLDSASVEDISSLEENVSSEAGMIPSEEVTSLEEELVSSEEELAQSEELSSGVEEESYISSEENETLSSEDDVFSEPIEESSAEAIESSEVDDSSVDIPEPGQGAWSLTSTVLPANPTSGTLHDQTFSVLNGLGQTVSFYADNIRTGEGTKGKGDEKVSLENTIQLTKETGVIYMTSGTASYLEFEIVRVIQTFDGVAHDYTGVPTIYSADEMSLSNGELVALSSEIAEDGRSITYSCILPHSQFRLENNSSNALYIHYINNLA